MPKRTFQTSEQACDIIYNIFLEHSRLEHSFPKMRHTEKTLKIHMDNYGIKPREIKVKVIKQRLSEIFNQNPNASEKEIERLLGVDIYEYLEDLKSKGIPDLRASFTGKKNSRKFDTKEEAVKAFRSKTNELVINGEYKGSHSVERIVGTNASTYAIRWKEEVLYPVYDKLIRQEIESDTDIRHKEIIQEYPFAQYFLKKQGGLKKFKEKMLSGTQKKAESTFEPSITKSQFKILELVARQYPNEVFDRDGVFKRNDVKKLEGLSYISSRIALGMKIFKITENGKSTYQHLNNLLGSQILKPFTSENMARGLDLREIVEKSGMREEYVKGQLDELVKILIFEEVGRHYRPTINYQNLFLEYQKNDNSENNH